MEARGLAASDMVVFSQKACGVATSAMTEYHNSSSVPLVSIDWFGDFVDPVRHDSLCSQIGLYYTNAGFVAGSEFVSVALALLHGGDSVSRIIVPVGSNPLTTRHDRVVNGLRMVAIDLDWLVG